MKAEEEEGKKKERCPWTILPSRLKRDDYMAASVQAVATATTLRTMSHFIVLNNSRSEEMFCFF